MIGTAQYLSPEQARGDEVTAASDCYAVGIVLYEMLTGRVPFDGEPPVAVAMKQISDEPVPPRIVEPSVPRELEAVVMRALAKRPSERYRTAEEMSRALAEARAVHRGRAAPTRVMAGRGSARRRLMGRPVTGPTRVGAAAPPAAPPRRRRRWPMIVGILVLLAIVAAGASCSSRARGGGRDDPAGDRPQRGRGREVLRDAGLEVTPAVGGRTPRCRGRRHRTDPAAGQEVTRATR